jgi:hypothetical protein
MSRKISSILKPFWDGIRDGIITDVVLVILALSVLGLLSKCGLKDHLPW